MTIDAETAATIVGRAKPSGRGWLCQCPAHDDDEPSLKIDDGMNGKLLVKCFAGCEQRAVTDAMKAIGAWPKTTADSAPSFRRPRREAAVRKKASEQEAADKAQRIWADASPVKAHDYAESKGVQTHRCRKYQDKLVIPLVDTTGTIVSLQFIAPTGDKRFLRGGRAADTYFPVGKIGDRLYLVEGFATGASVHEATGHAVAVCFSTATLSSAAEALRTKFPTLPFIFAADHDDAGLKAAQAAALLTGGQVVYPPFPGHDFNDMHQADGLDVVREVLVGPSKNKT